MELSAQELYKKETGEEPYIKEIKTDKWGEFPVELDTPTWDYVCWLETTVEDHVGD